MRKRQFGTVRRLPSGKWQARSRIGNRVVTAPDTFATRGDAFALPRRHRDRHMARGVFVDPRAGRVTLADWAQEWLLGNPAKRATTRARDESVLRTHFLPALGHRPIASLTPLDIRRTVEAMAAKVAPATVKTNLGVLRAVLMPPSTPSSSPGRRFAT